MGPILDPLMKVLAQEAESRPTLFPAKCGSLAYVSGQAGLTMAYDWDYTLLGALKKSRGNPYGPLGSPDHRIYQAAQDVWFVMLALESNTDISYDKVRLADPPVDWLRLFVKHSQSTWQLTNPEILYSYWRNELQYTLLHLEEYAQVLRWLMPDCRNQQRHQTVAQLWVDLGKILIQTAATATGNGEAFPGFLGRFHEKSH